MHEIKKNNILLSSVDKVRLSSRYPGKFSFNFHDNNPKQHTNPIIVTL